MAFRKTTLLTAVLLLFFANSHLIAQQQLSLGGGGVAGAYFGGPPATFRTNFNTTAGTQYEVTVQATDGLFRPVLSSGGSDIGTRANTVTKATVAGTGLPITFTVREAAPGGTGNFNIKITEIIDTLSPGAPGKNAMVAAASSKKFDFSAPANKQYEVTIVGTNPFRPQLKINGALQPNQPDFREKHDIPMALVPGTVPLEVVGEGGMGGSFNITVDEKATPLTVNIPQMFNFAGSSGKFSFQPAPNTSYIVELTGAGAVDPRYSMNGGAVQNNNFGPLETFNIPANAAPPKLVMDVSANGNGVITILVKPAAAAVTTLMVNTPATAGNIMAGAPKPYKFATAAATSYEVKVTNTPGGFLPGIRIGGALQALRAGTSDTWDVPGTGADVQFEVVSQANMAGNFNVRVSTAGAPGMMTVKITNFHTGSTVSVWDGTNWVAPTPKDAATDLNPILTNRWSEFTVSPGSMIRIQNGAGQFQATVGAGPVSEFTVYPANVMQYPYHFTNGTQPGDLTPGAPRWN